MTAILITGFLGLVIFVLVFLKCPRWAVAGLFITKPIIDLTWNYYLFNNVNFLKLYSGIFVILGIFYLIRQRRYISRQYITWIFVLFVVLNIASIFFITGSALFIDKIDYILRIVSGCVVLCLFPLLFDVNKDKRTILLIFIAAGAFPILLWFISVLTGNPGYSNDPLQRIIGPYHDFWNNMFYALQTILCCLALLAIRKQTICSIQNKLPVSIKRIFFRPWIQVGVLYILMAISVAMIYTCYTKTGWISLVVCCILWILLRKKYLYLIAFPVIVLLFIAIKPLSQDFQKTFRNEIDYYVYESDAKDEVFRGRLSRWERGMTEFTNAPLINKAFGLGKTDASPENDYLRVLWDNGIVGFVVYVILLVVTGFMLMRQYLHNKDPIVILAICILVMYMLHSIGSYPMLYPAFQWLMWGVIGFVLANKTNNVERKA
jgi:hypothetical protein